VSNNTTLNPGSNGDVIRTIDEGNVKTQAVALMGTQDNGTLAYVPASQEGHLEVEIHGPLNPFGSVHTENLTPIFQTDAVYGLNASQVRTTVGLTSDPTNAGTGTVTAANSTFICATGTTALSSAVLQSRKRLRYRAGQGVVERFAGYWSAPVADTYVGAGIGSPESGYFLVYYGTTFGILHSTGGVREIQTLTVSNQTTGSGNITITLNSIAYTVAVTALGTPTLTANEIASRTFAGWSVEARGATVVFLSNSVGNKAGTFSLALATATGTAGTFAETLAGVATTDVFIPQSSWNGDKCDGTGASSFTLDPTKGNVFQIGMAWLGFGPVTFSILQPSVDGNNANWTVIHTVNNPNSRTSVHASQPSFPFTAFAVSLGATTNASMTIGSFAGFIEGQKRLNGPRMTYFNTASVTSSLSAYTPIFSIRNSYVYSTRANQAIVNLLSVGGSANGNTNANTLFILIRNATLTGPVSWEAWSTTSATYADTGATGCTFSNNNQIIWTGSISQSGSVTTFAFVDDVTLQPGETITLAVRSVSATAACIAQLNTREDQ